MEKDGENYFSKLGKAGGKKSVEARRNRGNIQSLARTILDTRFKPNQNLKKALKGIGIDTSDKISLLEGILSVFSGKALSGDIVAAKFVMDVAGYSLYAKERIAKIKLLDRMATIEDGSPVDKEKPPMSLADIDAEAKKLGIYGD